MTGPEAAAIFYNRDFFVRKGAAPSPIKATLFGRGGLQGMDGVGHRRRKEMLSGLLSEERVSRLGMMVREIFRLESVRWNMRAEISFYEEAQKVLTEAVCLWAGIPMENENVKERALEIAALYDRVGSKGIGHFVARAHRLSVDDWISSLVRDVREGRLIPDSDSPLAIISAFKDHRLQLLDEKTAAVEILNLIRPTVAVSVYMTLIAHALSNFPDTRPDLVSEASMRNFLQEVRRFYPFFPAVAARAKKSFTWRGMKFRKGERVMLDIYGTNHDSRFWRNPQEFIPSRFEEIEPEAFAFIPQGGGDVNTGHRCPGEELALEIMKHALLFLSEDIEYSVPAQDLSIDFSRMPALPASHFRMNVVKLNYLNKGQTSLRESSYQFSHM
jgi:fatty-acid peroxygenase